MALSWRSRGSLSLVPLSLSHAALMVGSWLVALSLALGSRVALVARVVALCSRAALCSLSRLVWLLSCRSRSRSRLVVAVGSCSLSRGSCGRLVWSARGCCRALGSRLSALGSWLLSRSRLVQNICRTRDRKPPLARAVDPKTTNTKTTTRARAVDPKTTDHKTTESYPQPHQPDQPKNSQKFSTGFPQLVHNFFHRTPVPQTNVRSKLSTSYPQVFPQNKCSIRVIHRFIHNFFHRVIHRVIHSPAAQPSAQPSPKRAAGGRQRPAQPARIFGGAGRAAGAGGQREFSGGPARPQPSRPPDKRRPSQREFSRGRRAAGQREFSNLDYL